MIDKQSYRGQRCLNVYTYKMFASMGGKAADLRAQWTNVPLTALQAIQSDGVTRVSLTTINLNDPTDFEVFLYNGGGSGNVGGDALNPFYAYTFLYTRPSRLMRNGFKRFVGVPEAASTDGINLTGAYQTLCNTLGAALHAPLTTMAGDDWKPAIIHKSNAHPPVYTADYAAAVAFIHFGTQNTRKVGRGG